MKSLKTPLGRLRFIGLWEGVSFLVLLIIAMPLKYLAGWPDAVRVVGMAHGILFLLYLAAAMQVATERDWPWRRRRQTARGRRQPRLRLSSLRAV